MKKRKIIIVTILCISLLLPYVYADESQFGKGDEGYIIDQIQDQYGGYISPISTELAAQSFTPMKSPLAKIRLYIAANNPHNPNEDYPIKFSIRKDLYGADLTSVVLDKTHFFDEFSWVNIDFDDISVDFGAEYYIIADALSSSGEYHWGMYISEDIDKYEPGEAWVTLSEPGPVTWYNFTGCADFCFKTYAYKGRNSDLSCSGLIGLPDQIPGSMVTDDFSIENIGDDQSLLNWEIIEYPEWGNWTFTPVEGYDLEPSDGEFTVEVNIEVPSEENTDFSGDIVIVNKDNESDYETVSVSLSTPRNHFRSWDLFSSFPLFLLRLLQQTLLWQCIM